MQTLLQIAAQATRQNSQAQALLSHNLANAGTTGFKADLYEAQAGYIGGGGGIASAATILPLPPGVDFSPGNVVYTGNDLDIAITNDGWMQVITPQGEAVLSRRGDLRVDVDGRLTDATGNQIMGEGGPIALPPFSSMSIGADGTISIIPLGEPATANTAVDRIMLVNPPREELVKGADGEIRHPDIGGLAPDAAVNIAVGALEQSNVNPIAAMVEMIELSREFEASIKAMQSSDELNGASASLMKLE